MKYRLLDRFHDKVLATHRTKAEAVREAKRMVANNEIGAVEVQQCDDAQGLTADWFTIRKVAE